MRINIVNQTNEQECGVCVLTALHNYFYKDPIDKEEVLDKSTISDSGMTIFDFESIGSQLGIECESYELKFVEFQNLKINGYFVLLLATHGSNNHYVIARKKKKYIEIYDSCSLDTTKLSYSELKKIFLNVLILVKKKPNKAFSKTFGNAKTLLMLDLKFVLLNLGLSIIIIATSILTASFLNYVIDLAIANSSITNLITICFIFVLFYFVNDILTYVSNLYMSQHVKSYFVLFTNKILSSLHSKKFDFLNKVDKNWIFKVDECVYNISNFCIVEVNKFITNIILLFVCVCIIGSIQYHLLIFVVIYIAIEGIFFLFSYRKKKEVFLDIIRSENNNANLYKNLIVSLNKEVWSNKRKSLIEKIKNNYSNIYKNYGDVVLFKSNSSLIKSLLKSLSEIGLIALMSILIINENKLSIGKLTFLISAFGLLRNSSADLFNYFLSKLEFDVYWQVYKDLTSVGNINSTQKFELKDQIKTMCFVLQNTEVKLDVSKKFNPIYIPIIEMINKSEQISINGKNIELNKELMDSFIVVDLNSSTTNDMLMKVVEQDVETYAKYLRYFNLDINKNDPSFYDGIISNLLLLLSEKDKIIFIDDVIRYIKPKDTVVVNQLIHKIKKHNTVFILRKEEND